LSERTGLPYRVARDPVNATLRGAQALLWMGWRSGESDVTANGA
jgi:hypothetical protein